MISTAQNGLTPNRPPAGCVVVMAHPDDEVLWASSILADAGSIILCYSDFPGRPKFSKGRKTAVSNFPLPNVEFLGIVESTMFNHASWPLPVECAEGLKPKFFPLRLHGAVYDAYCANFRTLCRMLEARLAGVTDVVTHNPWGEYGHEDHVQVFRAVEYVSLNLGFKVWVTGYVSDKATLLMQRHLHRLGQQTNYLPTNLPLCEELRNLYVSNGCWTWPQDYVWPDREWFFPLLADNPNPEIRNNPWVQEVNLNMILFNWVYPGFIQQGLYSLLRHIRYRAVMRFPGLGRLIEFVRNRDRA